MAPPEQFDVAIVGAGPNGLTAAAYLSRAGARVLVLERRFERGGTFASDDYSTPFLYNQAQFLLPLGAELPPFRDLRLHDQALSFVTPAIAASVESTDEPLLVGRGGDGLGTPIQRLLEEADERVAPAIYRPAAIPLSETPELAAMTPAGVAAMAPDERGAIAVRYLCALAGFPQPDGPLGAIGAYCFARLLHPVIVAGGTKGLANALFRVAAAAGARCLVSAPVVALSVGANGSTLQVADGRRFTARAVVSTLDPLTTFGDLLGPDAAVPLLADLARDWALDATGSFTAHFGIKGEPPAPAAGEEDAAIRIVGFRSAGEVTSQLEAAGAGELPQRPAGHLTVTTAHDPLQASPGPYGPLHTLRYETPAPYELADGGWDRRRVGYRRECWELIRAETGALEQAVLLFAFADSPRDLERRFGTTRRGSLRQGSVRPGQTFTRRPHPSCADGRTPLDGLYLGGGGAHPGVPGSLGGGYLVAAAVCEDLGLERWWPQPDGRGGD